MILGVVVVLGVAAVVATTSNQSDRSGHQRRNAAASLVAKVTSVPQSVLEAVGTGSATLPQAISAPPLTSAGKPLVLYIGAEYCPYCAAERWAMVNALSRFGHLSKLTMTESSASDIFPNTPTFSFHGSSYESEYLVFEGVELQGNQLVGSSYPQLDTPTPEQQQVMATYDAPPYASSQGAIPFVDFANHVVVSGASYSPQVLQGMTAREIAHALADTTSPVTQGIIGTANVLTASICLATNDQPASVCASSVISAIEARLR